MLLTTNTIFMATDKLGRIYIYKFIGIKTYSQTGCDYIHMLNLTNNTYTDVEAQWFAERKIRLINTGDIVMMKDGAEWQIYKTSVFLDGTRFVGLTVGATGLHKPINEHELNWADVVSVRGASNALKFLSKKAKKEKAQ